MTDPANSFAREIPQDLDAISQRLVAARKSATALAEFPGQLPDNLTEAYTIQSASIARWPDAIAGWKVGMVPENDRARLAAVRLAGPIFKSSILDIAADSTTVMPVFNGGFAAIEAEFVLEMGKTVLPVEREYSDAELIEMVAALHVGAEIASSPMAAVNKLGPCCVVSDFGNNAGLLVGPSIPNWSSLALDSLTAIVTVDDVAVGQASASAIEGGLLQVLRYLLELCAQRGIALAAGTYISSGAVTGIHDINVDSRARVDFGTFGAFDVSFESMQPRH